MSFLKGIQEKAVKLKEKTQDRIKANGGFEGILQKTSEKVDQLAEAAGESIKKATNETKQYIQDAKDTAQEQGEQGFIGVAKTLGSKVGHDVSDLARSGYQKISNSELVQSLKKELQDADDQAAAADPETPKTDFSHVSLENIFLMFFSGVQKGNEWTTSSQPDNPKNARLIKLTYVVNGQEWFNTETQESGVGAFDLTLDFLANQTKLSLSDEESSKQLVMKTHDMMVKLVEQLRIEAEGKAQAEVEAKQEAVAPVKKSPAAKKTAVKKVNAVEDAPVETKASAKKTTTVKKAPATKTVKASTETTKEPVKSATAKKTPAVKKAPVAKKTAAKKDGQE